MGSVIVKLFIFIKTKYIYIILQIFDKYLMILLHLSKEREVALDASSFSFVLNMGG